jgi:protein involved in temperature-dependent protein secretion
MRWALILVSVATILLLAVACGDGGAAGGQEQIRQLHEEVLRHLKDERWSEMYELYSQDFQARCSRDEFLAGMQMGKTLVGEAEWEDLVKNAKLIAVANVQVEGDTATAEVTVEILGDQETDTALYVREDGRWRLAPDPGTAGCQMEATEVG